MKIYLRCNYWDCKEVIEMLKDLKKGQDELFRGQNERDKILNELQKGQEKLISRVDKIEENQQEMKTEMTKISQTVARIEVEHGEKLEILLDVVTGHTKQISSIKERVEKCEKRLDNHDDKFYVLNSAVQAY